MLYNTSNPKEVRGARKKGWYLAIVRNSVEERLTATEIINERAKVPNT